MNLSVAPTIRFVVEADPEFDDAAPIQVTPGERVTVVATSEGDFPGFVCVANSAGATGWVPKRYLNAERPIAVVVHPYDTTVLMPQVGDRVEVLEDDVESGWSWCRADGSAEGWVMNRALRLTDLTAPVRAQLTAYNARNIDAFIECYAEDCVVEDGIGTMLMRGRAAMRESYAAMFAASPELNCRLVSRIVLDEYVLDEERVTGRAGLPDEAHVVAVYRIADGLIQHVRFLR